MVAIGINSNGKLSSGSRRKLTSVIGELKVITSIVCISPESSSVKLIFSGVTLKDFSDSTPVRFNSFSAVPLIVTGGNNMKCIIFSPN